MRWPVYGWLGRLRDLVGFLGDVEFLADFGGDLWDGFRTLGGTLGCPGVLLERPWWMLVQPWELFGGSLGSVVCPWGSPEAPLAMAEGYVPKTTARKHNKIQQAGALSDFVFLGDFGKLRGALGWPRVVVVFFWEDL